jgi:2-iminobutanoate/2-iminopropanoate deaminase
MAMPVGPYTPIVRAGDFLICSGQLGLADGVLVDGLRAQVTQAMRNVSALLSAEGSGLHNVVKTTVLLTNMDDYGAMNDAYVAFFEKPPARTAFATVGLPLGALVEIEAWAYAPDTTLR